MRSNRILPLALTVLLAAAWCAGCMNPNGERRSATNYGSQKDAPEETGERAYGSQQHGGILIHENSKLAYSRGLSDAVSNIPGVYSAAVMLTDRNAYIAVMVDNTATGTIGGDAPMETNNTGTSQGDYNAATGSPYADPRQLATGFNSGYTTEHEEHLSHPFKQTIALTVRRLQPTVHDVFISANRGFVNQMNAYAQKAWSGNSLDSYVNDFNATCNRIFAVPEPDVHAND